MRFHLRLLFTYFLSFNLLVVDAINSISYQNTFLLFLSPNSWYICIPIQNITTIIRIILKMRYLNTSYLLIKCLDKSVLYRRYHFAWNLVKIFSCLLNIDLRHTVRKFCKIEKKLLQIQTISNWQIVTEKTLL